MENEDLKQIVGETDAAKKRAVKDEALTSSITFEQMLRQIAEEQLDSETKIKNEKAFNKKLRVWHAQENEKTCYDFQIIDRKTMKYSKKFIDSLRKKL